MRTDPEIRSEGFRLLASGLGAVEAERFIALLQRDRFDYTQWRKDQWQGETVQSLAEQARLLRQKSRGSSK